MTLKMFLIPLLITMFGGNYQTEEPIRAPIVLSHVIKDLNGNSPCQISYFAPASSDHFKVANNQAEAFFELSHQANRTAAVLICPSSLVLNESANPSSPGHVDLASWLHFLDVQTIEIFTAQIPENFQLSIGISCLNF